MALWVQSRRSGRGEAPFELLWERHRDATYRVVARILGPQQSLADEVFQDTWLEVARADHYQPGNFRGWVRTIATRKALDRLGAASIRTAALDSAEPRTGNGPSERIVSSDPDPERAVRAREAVAMVLEVVEDMPHAQRVAWVLKYIERMTFEELAEAMGTPVGTSKTRIRLANAFLAQALRERGITIADLDLDEEP